MCLPPISSHISAHAAYPKLLTRVGRKQQVFYAGKAFGFMSTVASNQMVALVAPKHETGYWNGVNTMAAQFASTVSIIAMAQVYDSIKSDACDAGPDGECRNGADMTGPDSDATRGRIML